MALGGRLFQGFVDALGLEARLAAAVRRACDEALLARAAVGRAEVDALDARVTSLTRQIAEVGEALGGVRQAVDAWALDLDDEVRALLGDGDLGPRLERLEAGLGEAEARVARLAGAQGVLDARLGEAATRVDHVRARAEQALQAAVTARATAEAVLDAELG